MAKPGTDALSDKHARAICEEIGDRLRFMLDRTAEKPSSSEMFSSRPNFLS